jgi:hypothetical protein
MSLRWLFLSFSLLFLAFGCANPTVNAPSAEAVQELISSTSTAQRASTEAKLEALQRKGDIFRETQTYHPYIKVINVYINTQLFADGTYSHPRIVSLPLILKQESLTYSTAALEAIFDRSNTQTSSQETSNSSFSQMMTPAADNASTSSSPTK